MNAVFTISSLAPENGGPSRSVPSLAGALSGRGLAVDILSLHFGARQSAPLVPGSGVRTHFVQCDGSPQFPGFWTSRFSGSLRQLASGNDVVIHDTGIWLVTNHMAARVSRKLRIPRIISPRGMLSPWALSFKSFKKKVAWRIYQYRDLLSARAFHVTSEEECQEVRDLGFRQPIAMIPNGIDTPADVTKTRNKGPRTALFLSRIHPKKGLRHLVEAWATLRPVGWRVEIAGPDENGHKSEIEHLVREKKLQDQFAFIGPVDDQAKWDIYRRADLFVLPSFSENFGLVIAEALAAGIPVIATKGTPWQDLVHHRCGWWIDVEVQQLTDALRQAIELPDAERHEMGSRGRKLIEQKYSWRPIAEQMEAVYRWILHGGSLPSCLRT